MGLLVFFRELIKTNALSELSDQLVRASLLGMCRAGRPGFESRSNHQLFIGNSHLVH